jgi:ABC-2 type transport system ATP-binding protein
MSIEVKQITKQYGQQKALNNVSFNINKGEVVGLLGPNGAGKSTMMKIITCFIPPTSGEVLVEGFDIIDQSMQVRKNVGYLPENNPLYLDMYVKEYLEFIYGIHKLQGDKKKRIKEMIEMTGLQVEQHKKIGTLSKGYRQRVGLAQALMHDPEVLILDEPTSGLDPNQIVDIRNLIKDIGKEKTVMLSTHIMQEVEAICDRAIIINKGKIVADDSTENLHNLSAGKQKLIVEFNKGISANKLKTIVGVKNAINKNGNIWELEVAIQKDIREDVFQFAVKNELSVLSMNKQEQSLEEVFQALTRE